ncbi:thioesterase family protein [Arthrobacter antibioticus]|uniref:thioesterase family protein n=1 Tax=Arthrobacter sp. H35-MC1 TaxID=3046203 RepID=UPI0024B94732|nr:thioesterase family protein [Arthrobacter sp. H35-MC1]MDJ0318509.1 thioesterase family protein [Arthrobacter sp. H35-MC1]
MHLLLRTLFHIFCSWRRPAATLWGNSSVPMRVWPSDIDVARQLNNGMYFSLMDLGRMDLIVRSGAWKKMLRRGWSPVSGAETISFRKSLQLWQKYSMETRIIGTDERGFYFEQRMVVTGEIYAQSIVWMRFVGKGRPIPMEQLLEVFGLPPQGLQLPAWVHQWQANNALPSARNPAPHNW